MADGSVKFLKSSSGAAVYGGLCSRNLGEVVSVDGY